MAINDGQAMSPLSSIILKLGVSEKKSVKPCEFSYFIYV